MQAIKACLFDVDGTLLDSMPIWDELADRYLLKKGKEPEPGLSEILFPMSFDEGAEYVKRRYDLEESPEAIQEEMRRDLESFYLEEAPMKPGVKAFLEALKARGIPMALCTSNSRFLIKGALKRLELLPYFEALLTCDELGTTKSEPEIFLAGAKALSARPEETLVFEDALFAIQTATKAGFPCVAVRDENSLADEAALRALSRCYLEDFEDAERRLFA